MYIYYLHISGPNNTDNPPIHLTSASIMNKSRDIFPLRMRGLLSTIQVPYLEQIPTIFHATITKKMFPL